MTGVVHFEFRSGSQAHYEDVLETVQAEAVALARQLLSEVEPDENGCLVTETVSPKKVRFRGFQDRVYRFVYYVLNTRVPHPGEVVRHRCNNRLCINPAHLVAGTHADNLQDEHDFQANGVDFSLLLRG